MATSKQLARRLLDAFIGQGYTWRIGGKQVVPVEEDFIETLDMAKKALYDEPVPSQMEVGGLIIRHHKPGQFNVYLQIGSYND